jgi:UDP-glucose:(glucosyl)LPS alpha-1,2-glucosyltransferase
MSVIYKGQIIDTNLSRSAMGGTEQMRARLVNGVDSSLLQNFAIHFSRVIQIYDDVQNIFYAHDTAGDPANSMLDNDGWKRFDLFVFVSCWQRDSYVTRFRMPYSKCRVIENAIEPAPRPLVKSDSEIRLIYHTTPHRGLQILYPVFDALTKNKSLSETRLHLDVFSSFEVYGWKERDRQYQSLFEKLKAHPNITYHGTKPNSVVRDYLSRAHYFVYPSIWPETSCIAMIEAIEHGVIAIHPNLAALPETAGRNTFMYDYTDDVNEHAARVYDYVLSAIACELQKHKVINTNPRHHIATYISRWTNLLKEIQHGE